MYARTHAKSNKVICYEHVGLATDGMTFNLEMLNKTKQSKHSQTSSINVFNFSNDRQNCMMIQYANENII